MYLFAPVAFAMKVTALHLWSIFTPKSGANAKEREKRMHFDVAQRFAALIAGVKQTSLKLRAEASAGLPRSVRGYGFVARDVLGTWGWFRTMYRAPRVHFAFGEMPHIEALAFCVQAARVPNIRTVTSDCMTKCRDYEFRVLDPSALFAKKSQKNC